MQQVCDYSFAHYKYILKLAKNNGYKMIKVSETVNEQKGKVLVLRHDIDISPKYALKMAEIEHEEGIVASYYILLHSKFYNPLTPKNLDIFKKIKKLGHEIGLHYDTSVYSKKKTDILNGILNEIKILELILSTKITSISQHNPATSPFIEELNKYVIDAYNKDLINGKYKYLSDSGQKWRNGCMCHFLGKYDKIHVLIHPISWSFEGKGFKEIFNMTGVEIYEDIQEEFNTLSSTIKSYLKKREELDKIREKLYDASKNNNY